MSVSTAVLLFCSALVAQGPPPPPPQPPSFPPQQPRDVVRRPEPTGTAVIRGRVVAADTGAAIRRANVNLVPVLPVVIAPPPGTVPPAGTVPPGTVVTTQMTINTVRPRTLVTDSQGNFEFAALPAGSYRIMASPGQYNAGYLGIAYGGKRPNGPFGADLGTTIELADGQRFDKATIALPRGAVITGRVTDENGGPLARVQVSTLFFAPGSQRGMRTSGAQTDDLGHFRLYGLASGEYVIMAEAREPTFVPPNAPAETEEDQIGLMTTYYPGTPDEAAAQRVRTKLGAETPGLEIRMAVGRLFRVSGTVTDSQGRASARSNGQLMKRIAGGASTSSYGFNTDEQGRFQMRNIPPGNYRLVVRGRGGPNMGPQQGGETGEAISLPVTINSDIDGIVVILSPGATITGQVVFEQGPPQLPPGQQSFQMRVNANPDPEANMGLNSSPPGLVTPDLTFTMRGMHGELLLRTSGPGMFLKSVAVGGRDVTDTPYEFKTGDQVTIVMTTRASSVEGTVTDTTGKPVTDAGVLVFSDDKSSWRFNSIRTRRSGVDATGKYRITGLLSGRYHLLAVTRDRLNLMSNADAAVFEQFTKEATPFVIGEDEQRQVDLKVAPGAGG